jgi:hypothetical protein
MTKNKDNEKSSSSSLWPLPLQLWKKKTTMTATSIPCHRGFESTHNDKKQGGIELLVIMALNFAPLGKKKP